MQQHMITKQKPKDTIVNSTKIMTKHALNKQTYVQFLFKEIILDQTFTSPLIFPHGVHQPVLVSQLAGGVDLSLVYLMYAPCFSL